ncbi:MAG: alpha/beta fold hydrolase [Lewinellaceae bacterium]|nr:alpha/beta fold hydrolase [Lewinellaceae bacterium]
MVKSNISLPSASGKPILLDLHYPENPASPPPVAVFLHGFKGFKDWGWWRLGADAFARAGIAFLRCNFSHNGVTADQLEVFADMEAFGQNNYSRELADIRAIIDWLHLPETQRKYPTDRTRLTLIGHSRGGGIAIIAAREDARVRRLNTWASVDGLDFLWYGRPELIESWRKNDVLNIPNARTKQQMPLHFQLYEDFEKNAARFDIPAALRDLTIPMLISHGDADSSIPPSAARRLQAWNPSAELRLIEGADHVFGGRHPYEEEDLPAAARELVAASVAFCLGEAK